MESEERMRGDLTNRSDDENASKKSSSIYERLFPMRHWLMGIGGFIFLVGLGMFIGGFAGLVADMDVKIRRTGAPNIGYLLMLIVSVVVMVAGGVSLFCGCGTIRYNKRKNELEEARKNGYIDKKPSKKTKAGSSASQRSTTAFSAAQIRTLEPNGDVTYTVTYQYRGPRPGQINGIPAYPAPPDHISPTLKIDPLRPVGQQNVKLKPLVQQRPAQPPLVAPNRETALALSNVPRKLVLVKRV